MKHYICDRWDAIKAEETSITYMLLHAEVFSIHVKIFIKLILYYLLPFICTCCTLKYTQYKIYR